MADDRDDSQKTDEPTQRRLEDARKRGDFANSREIGHGFIMLAGTLASAGVQPERPSAAGVDPAGSSSPIRRPEQ